MNNHGVIDAWGYYNVFGVSIGGVEEDDGEGNGNGNGDSNGNGNNNGNGGQNILFGADASVNTVLNTGIISAAAEGDVAAGVHIGGNAIEDSTATNRVENWGVISASGDTDIFGVYIEGNGSPESNTVENLSGPVPGRPTVRMADDDDDDGGSIFHGSIYATGDSDVYGVYIEGNNSTNNVTNSGDITTYAENEAYGIYIEGNNSTNTVTNSGDITAYAENDEAYGVYIEGYYSTNIVTNSGTIIARVGDFSGSIPDDDDDDHDSVGVYIGGYGGTNTVTNEASGWISGTAGVGVEGPGKTMIENSGVIQGTDEGSPAIVLGDGENEVSLHAGQALYGAEDEGYGADYRPGVMYADGFATDDYGGYGKDTLILVGDDGPDTAPCVTCGRIYNDAARRIPADTLAAYQIQGFDALEKTGAGAWVITKYDELGNGTHTEGILDEDLLGYTDDHGGIFGAYDLFLQKSGAELALTEGLLATNARIRVGYGGEGGRFQQDDGSTLGLMVAPDTGYTDDDDAEIGTYPITDNSSGYIHVAGGSSGDLANIEEGSQLLVIPQMPETGVKYARESSYAFLFVEGGIGGAYAYGPGEVPVSSPFFAATAEKEAVDTGNQYRLTLERDFALPAAERNELAVGQALNTIYGALDPEGNEAMIDHLNRFLVCGGSPGGGRYLLEDLGGLVHTTAAVSALSGLRQYYGTLTDRMGGLVSGGPGTIGFAPVMGPMFAQNSDGTASDVGRQLMSAGSLPSATADTSQWGLWSRVFGSIGDADGSRTASKYDTETYGITVGFDGKIGSQALLGMAVGYAFTNTEMDKVKEEVDVDSYQFALYGVYNPDPWYVSAILSYARNDYESDRKIRFTGEKLKADYDGNMFSGYVEAGYRWEAGSLFDIIPSASFQATYLDTDSFREKGGPSALKVKSDDYTSLVSTLGVRVRKEFATANGFRFIPEFRARWAHEFGSDDYSAKGTFANAPLARFKVKGDDPEDDAALLGLGFTAILGRNLSLYVDYDANLSSDFTEHTGALGIRYRW